MDKAPVTFLPAAIAKVSALMGEEGNPNLKLRMYVQGGGCSGFKYGFSFDEHANGDDTVFVDGGLTVLIDVMSIQYLTGATVDYVDDLTGAQFVVKNPNASASCGCGSSFTV